MKAQIAASLLLLSSCSKLPWDSEGTMERVQKTQVLRAGIISEGDGPQTQERRFLDALARETGSRPTVVEGSTEQLLPQIERGELDVVVGQFAADTPWAKRVTIMPTPRQMGVEDGSAAPAAVIRNGENGWVALVYRHAAVLKEGMR
jgi:hypothetical protein